MGFLGVVVKQHVEGVVRRPAIDREERIDLNRERGADRLSNQDENEAFKDL
jgi:hypothetical protein